MKNLHWRCSWCFHYREDDLNVYMKCPTTVLETGFNGCLDCCLNRIYSTSKKTWQIVCANILPKSLVVCHDMCSLVPICIWKWHPYQTGNLFLAFVKIFPNNKHNQDRGRVIFDNVQKWGNALNFVILWCFQKALCEMVIFHRKWQNLLFFLFNSNDLCQDRCCRIKLCELFPFFSLISELKLCEDWKIPDLQNHNSKI